MVFLGDLSTVILVVMIILEVLLRQRFLLLILLSYSVFGLLALVELTDILWLDALTRVCDGVLPMEAIRVAIAPLSF